MKCIITTHRRLSRPWISGWYFQAWEAPVRRISPCNEGHLARRQKYGPRMVVSAQRAPGRSEAATAPRTCGNWRTDVSHKEAFVYTVFTGAAGMWKGMGLDYKTFLPLRLKKKKKACFGKHETCIQACHLDIYHGACLHTIKRLSLDCFQRGGRRATKGPIILNHLSPFRWR